MTRRGLRGKRATQAPGGVARLLASESQTSPLSGLGVPFACPSRVTANGYKRMPIRFRTGGAPPNVSRCRLIRRLRDPQQGQFGTGTEQELVAGATTQSA